MYILDYHILVSAYSILIGIHVLTSVLVLA